MLGSRRLDNVVCLKTKADLVIVREAASSLVKRHRCGVLTVDKSPTVSLLHSVRSWDSIHVVFHWSVKQIGRKDDRVVIKGSVLAPLIQELHRLIYGLNIYLRGEQASLTVLSNHA